MSKIKKGWVPLEKKTSTSHLDLSRAVPAPDMPRLHPSTTVMNVRVPLALMNALKREANRRDVPYQSLVKVFLHEKLAEVHPAYSKNSKNAQAFI